MITTALLTLPQTETLLKLERPPVHFRIWPFSDGSACPLFRRF